MKITIESNVELDSKDINRITDTIIPRIQDLKDNIDELPEYIKDGVIYASVMILIGAERNTGNNDEMVDEFKKLCNLKDKLNKEGKNHGKS